MSVRYATVINISAPPAHPHFRIYDVQPSNVPEYAHTEEQILREFQSEEATSDDVWEWTEDYVYAITWPSASGAVWYHLERRSRIAVEGSEGYERPRDAGAGEW